MRQLTGQPPFYKGRFYHKPENNVCINSGNNDYHQYYYHTCYRQISLYTNKVLK